MTKDINRGCLGNISAGVYDADINFRREMLEREAAKGEKLKISETHKEDINLLIKGAEEL